LLNLSVSSATAAALSGLAIVSSTSLLSYLCSVHEVLQIPTV
jgi:hypothetical protein